MFLCGVSQFDITPKDGMHIPGYFGPRFVTGRLDTLYAKAIAMENKGVRFISVVLDAIGASRQDVLRIRRGISKITGVPENQIAVSATHTHTGGPVWTGFGCSRDPEYITFMVEEAVKAGITAFNAMAPASIGFKTLKVSGIAFNRRYYMKDGTLKTNPGIQNPDIIRAEGPVDENFTVGVVKDTNGKVFATISSYGVHLDMVGSGGFGDEKDVAVSADYPSVIAKEVEEEFGKDVISIYYMGFSGNTNHIDVTDPDTGLPGHYQRVGRKLAKELIPSISKIWTSKNPKIKIKNNTFITDLRIPTDEEIEFSRKVVNDEIEFDTTGDRMFVPKPFCQGIMDSLNREDRVTEIELMTVEIGNDALVFWPGEIFVEYGLTIRNMRKGKNTILTGLSNGTVACYVPTPHGYQNGGYEPRLNGERCVSEDTGTKMTEQTIQMLK